MRASHFIALPLACIMPLLAPPPLGFISWPVLSLLSCPKMVRSPAASNRPSSISHPPARAAGPTRGRLMRSSASGSCPVSTSMRAEWSWNEGVTQAPLLLWEPDQLKDPRRAEHLQYDNCAFDVTQVGQEAHELGDA